MFKEFWGASRFYLVAGAVFVAGIFCADLFRSPVSVDWWSPLSAIATTAAVFAALWIYIQQHKAANDREKDLDAALLLGFHQMAKEVARMCNLSGFQNDSPKNPIFYPDTSAEFAVMAELLSGLPMDRLAFHGQVSRMLHLRRIGIEMSILWKENPERNGRFYLNNRSKIDDLHNRANKESIAIGEYLLKYSPELYTKNKYESDRM